jgi:hypothetical protein
MRAEAIRWHQLEASAFRIKPVGLKRLGEAVRFVYGDCRGEIRRSRCSSTADHENTGQLLTQRLVASGWLNVTENRPTRRQVRKPLEPMRGLWHRAMQTHGLLFVDWSSRRIPWCRGRQVGKKDQSSLLAQRASSDIDAGDLKHQLVN